MPKRVGFLYEKMCNKDLIRIAIINSSQHKRHRHDVQKVIRNMDKYVDKTYDILINEAFKPSIPKKRMRYDTPSHKEREISVVPYWPDGVVHQLMVLVLKDVFMRGMYSWTCATVPGRGGARAKKYVQCAIRQDVKGTKYILKLDVKRFYPSINHEKVMVALSRKVKDKRFLNMVSAILDTSDAGLPIGFYICQWLANFYLEPLDRYICSLDGCEYYVRYMDDMVIMGRNKKKLHKIRKLIDAFLNEKLLLTMKENWQVFPLKARPLDFVGVKQYRKYCTLRKRTFLRFIRQCRRALRRRAKGWSIPPRMAAGLISRAGLLKGVNCYKARQKYYTPIGEKLLKDVIRNESKRRNETGYRIQFGVYPQKAGQVAGQIFPEHHRGEGRRKNNGLDVGRIPP